jgi:hypothetical protein
MTDDTEPRLHPNDGPADEVVFEGVIDDLDAIERVARAAQGSRGPHDGLFPITCSPDVVLALVERARAAEAAVRFLYDAWSEAEGSGQPEGYVFGDENEESIYRRPSAEVQAVIRDVLERVARVKVYKGEP